MRRRPVLHGEPSGGAEEVVSISKTENGYIVSLCPNSDSFMDLEMSYMMPYGERLEPHEIATMKEARDKSKPRTFVFLDLENAWEAIKGFLLDGRMPKGR